ncbi:nitrate reductase molybdenum cofactor assembly chaperone [Corynebacterium sp.]|uniref:nitrate reductase molybdenum cofactor assembly chaperone n=1 Tax=Corynebacterium sp. TaxID=1720 RepID=UPI002A917572|nr:nitrate reductase molybdenum cofactor assembly chaperone [Corynebacterium sp.]MDY5786252.1 nitrate reductase molybdenum cofactor assembly chaperone [Corynebacterium sp.]
MRRTHAGPTPDEFVAPVEIDVQQRRVTAMAVSLLLRYPDEDFSSRVDAVAEQLPMLPPTVAHEVGDFIAYARGEDLRALQEEYVDTFDQRRRCSLFLSYYSVGDTRQRGAAILAFRQQLAGLGVEEISDELPDHLCVVLEALALCGEESLPTAVDMVASHREGIEVLRRALTDLGSAYSSLITALCMSLPHIDESTAARYINLIRQGPPSELVGLDTTPLPFPTAQPDLV